jgi:acid stress chaperone HdeA
MKRIQAVMASGLVAAAMISGCSSSVMSQGGDTKCKDFASADEKTQNNAITKMIKDRGGTEPTNLELSGTRLAVSTFCQTLGTQDSKISEAPHL